VSSAVPHESHCTGDACAVSQNMLFQLSASSESTVMQPRASVAEIGPHKPLTTQPHTRDDTSFSTTKLATDVPATAAGVKATIAGYPIEFSWTPLGWWADFAKKIENVKQKLNHVGDIKERIYSQARDIWNLLLPGYQPKRGAEGVAFVCVTLAVAWFLFYFLAIFQSDRSEINQRYRGANVHDKEIHETCPDLLLAFHHPCCDRWDSKRSFSPAFVERIIEANKAPFLKWFKRLADGRNMSLGVARTALLRDMYRFLPAQGFDVVAFCSVDNTVLYVGVSLHNKDTLNKYLLRDNARLKLHDDIPKKLNIKQPMSEPESAPPSFHFDPRNAEWLHTSGVLTRPEVSELYGPYDDSDEGYGHLPVHSSERIRIIFTEISAFLDLKAAQEHGLLLDFYLGHSYPGLAEFRNVWSPWWKLFDPLVMQPVHMLKNYFGSQVAFHLAWNGLYCKALLGLILPALLCEVCMWRNFFHLFRVDAEAENRNPHLLGCSVILVIWGQLASQLWDQEQAFLLSHWELQDDKEQINVVRPEFHGTLEHSPVDRNIMELHYPSWKRNLWVTLSDIVMLLFCALVIICTATWVNLFGEKMDMVAAVMLSVQIGTLEQVYLHVVVLLVKLENHKFQADHYNSLLWKQCIFRMVNSYCPFFYLILMEGGKAGCPNNDCFAVLRRQLITTLAIRMMVRVMQANAMFLLVKARLWFFNRDICRGASFAERQRSYNKFDMPEQIEVMLQLMLSLGYVLLFGSAAPLIVPLCFLVFRVQVQASAMLLTECTRRPFPQRIAGIGVWCNVVQALMAMGVVTNGFLIVHYGIAFAGTQVTAKLTGCFLYCILAAILRACTSNLGQSQDSAVKLLEARRNRVLQVLSLKITEGLTRGGSDYQTFAGVARQAKEVEACEWTSIGHFRTSMAMAAAA